MRGFLSIIGQYSKRGRIVRNVWNIFSLDMYAGICCFLPEEVKRLPLEKRMIIALAGLVGVILLSVVVPMFDIYSTMI